ncbi:MAG TPA: metallopeptidase TldD-related protein, partial [Spirochaetia bacterium]|nr:metallopeptidase TldD-related protein [Spirochaetia bacterium]
ERHRLCYAYAYVMADSGRGVETGVHLQAARSFEGLDPAAIAREAVARAVGKLGAAEPQSGTMRAVLENGAATSLLGAFMGSASAEAIQKGRSRLAGKRGERVGGALFTVVDDPAGPGLRGAAFDDEGLPAARLEVFREGVFLEPLYTVYSARREGAKPNGRGFRGSALASVSASLVNATIPAGSFSLEALAAEAGKGILVTEVEGLHAGLNPVSGDFSCSARGFALEGGRIGAPLRNFTISGNFYELVAGLEAVGSDLREDVLDRFRSPSLLVASLSVSGA